MKNIVCRTAGTAAILLATTTALQAHPADAAGTGLVEGLMHPISGLDHVLAMVAVGLWAGQMGRRAQWAVPLAFIAAMIGGGLLGLSGFPLPLVETGIAGSVLLLGALVAAQLRPALPLSIAIVGLFAVFHGFAHGAEAPASAAPLFYGLGFVAATALLHASGFALMRLVREFGTPTLPRLIGGTMSAVGLVLFAIS